MDTPQAPPPFLSPRKEEEGGRKKKRREMSPLLIWLLDSPLAVTT